MNQEILEIVEKLEKLRDVLGDMPDSASTTAELDQIILDLYIYIYE